MVEKIFWQDPYLSQLDATITTVTADEITLDRTLFFAFSGGQESDRGSIAEQPVLAARRQEKEIVYTLPADHGLRPGQRVRIEIDWPRRLRLMRLHFACEIVLELVYEARPGIEKIGAHIAEDKARIDFLCQDSISPLLSMLTQRLNEIVAADLPIQSAYSDEANERRYWCIEGFGRVPCGGTHLRHTGEVGNAVLKRKNPGKGKERIEIYVDG